MKTNLAIHLVAQILAQTAVQEIVPAQYKAYFVAVVAIVGAQER